MILEWTAGAYAQIEHRQDGEGGAWNYSLALAAPAAATVYAGNRRRGSIHRYEVRLSSWVAFLVAMLRWLQ